MIVVGIIALR